MSLLIGALSIGFILALLALGVYISFRIFDFPDITAEGSITLGASVTAVLLVNGWSSAAATLMAPLAGMVAGAVTGILAMKFRINIALRWGLNPNDLKLITAAFVFVALILPKLLDAVKARQRRVSCA
jgi:ABC-type uncharacterized transport system permease subunit